MSLRPLSAEARGAVKQDLVEPNLGLWFERYFAYRPAPAGGTFDPNLEAPKKNDREQFNPKLDFLKEMANGTCGSDAALTRFANQMRALADARGGHAFVFGANGRWLTGSGNPHPTEVGLQFHPTLGVPYYSGATVKGLVRAWVENWVCDELTDDQKTKAKAWFGAGGTENSAAGDVIFFDAVPVAPVKLSVDVLTPHSGRWYNDGWDVKVNTHWEVVPADWHSPVPVPYLTALGGQLLFAIAPRPGATNVDLKQVWEWLVAALRHAGAGAKTSIGYGRFAPTSEAAELSEKFPEGGFKVRKSVSAQDQEQNPDEASAEKRYSDEHPIVMLDPAPQLAPEVVPEPVAEISPREILLAQLRAQGCFSNAQLMEKMSKARFADQVNQLNKTEFKQFLVEGGLSGNGNTPIGFSSFENSPKQTLKSLWTLLNNS